MKRSLSGIKPTGSPHLGNYFGMMRRAIDMQKSFDTAYFIANYHALTTARDPDKLREDTLEIAAIFIAAGYDTDRGILYRQADVPQVTELTSILANYVSMGDLMRAHAYKAAKDQGNEGTLNAGVFMYPVLMAADILIHDADVVPVGRDQVQHLEMARAIAGRFNHYHGNVLKEPQEHVDDRVAVVPGIDGRKMSKSYGNGIEPFGTTDKALKQQVMAIVSDSKGVEEPKDPDTSNIVAIYKLFATDAELADMQAKYRAGGYGYGHAKVALLDKIHEHFDPMRKRYLELMNDRAQLEKILQAGAAKASARADAVLKRTRRACGLE
ncbi:MAG TPA: tryptophan--tRNA ligase [Bdellovibrionota bacterium]|jgi:tryptophanyl-tRNA synthetase|nr:tryptophan--tRNA ligase [Bdellovibrionota bacterium]